MTLRKSARHKRPRWLGLAILVVLGLAVAQVTSVLAAPGDVSLAAGFEGNDGNLVPGDDVQAADDSPDFDWNSFATTSWATGTAPYRSSAKVFSGWSFVGLEDAQVDGDDTAFAGGTKQDNDCPTVKAGPKPPNKDDLERVYVASTTGDDGHVYLALGWVRIPQNTTNASAHVAFEFNQANLDPANCPITTIPGNDGLVRRSTDNGGDALIVYDFEGSSTDTPAIKLSRWIASGTCEVASNAPPCWGNTQVLTTLGFADAKVNTSDVGSVSDTISPTSPAAESLGNNEFGEAIIDLTGAQVFPEGECVAFGKVYAVSRSSGNSAQAQMKDLVGPGDIDLQNCGSVIIRKETNPSPDPLETDFDFTATGGLDPSTFALADGEDQDYGAEVEAGSYSVTEPGEDNYVLTDIDCSDSDLTNGSTIDINDPADGAGDTDGDFQAGDTTVDFTLVGQDSIDCTFTNTLQTGAIKVTKTSKNANCVLVEGAPTGCDVANNAPLAGASFEIWEESNGLDGLQTEETPDLPNDPIPADTNVAGPQATALNAAEDEASTCFDPLLYGDYYVYESAAPLGYAIDTASKVVSVDNTAACADASYVGELVAFTNTPLSEIEVLFTSLAGPGVTAATIDCTPGDSGDTTPTDFDDTDETITDLAPGIYTCIVVVDP
jgi:hypothetical protein